MGGKGGLNILPQKKWNVYNWDNRIKVIENEKIVDREIERIERKRKDKNLSDKAKILKKGEDLNLEKYNFYEEEKYDKNKIFKEVMQRKSMDKRLKVDMLFESRNKPMKSEEQLKFFEMEEKDAEKYFEEKESQNNITFKESIKNHLNPWYIRKRKQDLKDFQNLSKIDDKFLGKKHTNDRNDSTKNSISEVNKAEISEPVKSGKRIKSIEELRRERLEREKKEKEKIDSFMNSQYNKKN
jgi:hypothetical protein